MALIVLYGPNGLRRVPENTPYVLQPGEQVVGSEEDPTETQLNDMLVENSIPIGDFIEKAFKLLPEAVRPTHCSKCEKRKQVLNHLRENGVMETFKKLREIG